MCASLTWVAYQASRKGQGHSGPIPAQPPGPGAHPSRRPLAYHEGGGVSLRAQCTFAVLGIGDRWESPPFLSMVFVGRGTRTVRLLRRCWAPGGNPWGKEGDEGEGSKPGMGECCGGTGASSQDTKVRAGGHSRREHVARLPSRRPELSSMLRGPASWWLWTVWGRDRTGTGPLGGKPACLLRWGITAQACTPRPVFPSGL